MAKGGGEEALRQRRALLLSRPRRGPPQCRLRINVAYALKSAEALELVSKQQGWETAHSAGHIVWVVRKEDLGTCLLNLNQKARLSHIPGMHEVCEKAALASALEAVAAPFWPRSWRPQDLDFSVAKESVVIVKPSKGLQGRGIHLAGSPEELRQILAADADVVVQEYISRPLLLDGRKWDLRLYALVVPGYDGGLRCWLARDGLVRVCTDPYREPDATNLRCQTAHLTNYSLNKRSEKFVRNEDPGNGRHGCKRTFSAVLAGLQADGALEVSTSEIWSSLEELASETIRAMASPLRRLAQDPATWERSQEVARAASQKFDQCFHILGLDVLLDSSCKPWLLEVNCNPSFSLDEIHALQEKDKGALPTLSTREIGYPCACSAHPQVHVHKVSPVDLAVKLPVLQGAVSIIGDLAMGREGPTEGLSKLSTIYVPI